MMRNKKELKGFLLTATRLVVLALCFVTAFAVALTSDVIVIDGSDSALNVANAAKTDADKGGCVPLHISGFEADAFKFPTAGVWAVTQSLARISISAADGTGNASVYKPEKTNIDVNISASGNQYVVQADGLATAYIQVTSRMCFDLGDFVNAAIQAGYVVKVTVDASVSFEGGSNRQNGALAVATIEKANTSEPRDAYATTVTLTKAKPYLVYETYSTAQNQTVFTDPIKHTVTFNSVKVEISLSDGSTSDGAAPVVSSQYDGLDNSYVKGESGSGYAPYITSAANSSDFPVYFDEIKDYLRTDSVTNGTGDLLSYTNKELGKINGESYYKFAQTEYVDLYNRTGNDLSEMFGNVANYGADVWAKVGAGDKVLSVSGNSYSWNDPSATHFLNASGIKTVKVGDTVFDMYNSSGNANGSQTKEVAISDTDGNVQIIGYATVTRTNRSRVVVSIYFTTNGTVQTTVSDFSGAVSATTLNVSGIDTSSDNKAISYPADTYFKALGDIDKMQWLRSQQFAVNAECKTDGKNEADYSPILWFVTAFRTDVYGNIGNAPKFNNITELLASGLSPVGYEDNFKLEYDFSSGKIKGLNSSVFNLNCTIGTDKKLVSDANAAKGHGYYVFTTYRIDLAGNMSSVISTNYMKVDYDSPAYSVNLSYLLDGETETIEAENNGTWAKGATTLELVLTSLGFSGNSIVFDAGDVQYMFVFENNMTDEASTRTSRFAKYYASTFGLQETAKDVSDNRLNIAIAKREGNYAVTVAYEYDVITDTGKLTFVIDHESIEWTAKFTEYTGAFATINEINNYSGYLNANDLKSYINPDWKKDNEIGVLVLIDTKAPETPSFVSGEDTPYSFEFASYESLPAYSDRHWYTGAYDKYVATIDFTDLFINSKYVDDIKLYYGIKVIKNLDQLGDQGDLMIERDYASITQKGNYFDRFTVLTGSQLDALGDTLVEDGAMNIVTGEGMRIIYVWAVDQAGNPSELKTYYLLADNNTYTISAKVGKNSVLDASASIVSYNNENKAQTKFTRGEIATLKTALGDAFVPFALNLTLNGNTKKILANYNSIAEWTIADTARDDGYDGYLNYDDPEAIEFAIDDPNNLGILDNTKTLTIEFAYRKVVDYTVTNTSIEYNSKPVVIPMAYTDTASRNAFEFTYYDSEGNKLATAPTNTGKYSVEIFIDKENANYVVRTGVGRFDIEIVKGRIVISAVESNSVYGDSRKDKLTFTASGIALEDMSKEGISEEMLALVLDIAGYDASALYDVGYYTIVLKDTSWLDSIEHYSVTFQSAQHRITQRTINVYTQSAEKFYGDDDPDFLFGVKESDLTFNGAKTAEELLADIFPQLLYGTATKQTNTEGTLYLYSSGGRVRRVQGETVFEYEFTANADLFETTQNYVITVQKQGLFSIRQRVVQIDVSGQFSVIKSKQTADPNNIVPSYTLAAKDAFLADVIKEMLAGKLRVDTTSEDITTGFDTDKYEKATGFAIILETTESTNIKIVLANAAKYIVYNSIAGTIIVKANREFTFVYGFKWAENEITFSAEYFDVEKEDDAPEFDTIKWTASISSGDEYVKAGKYVVSFSDAKLYLNGAEVKGNVNVESAVVNVTPASIVVRSTAAKFAKTYGDDESIFGIGFEIATINGATIANDGTFAGMTYGELLAKINGSFARAKYLKDGTFQLYGTRYDDVLTDNDYYYGYTVNRTFTVNDESFSIKSELDKDARFTINPKELVINTAGIVGVSKNYDGTDAVEYGSVLMFDLANQLVLATDDVRLDAKTKQYNIVGNAKTNTAAHIRLGEFFLTGEKSGNYKLIYIVNDGYESVVTGDKYQESNNFAVNGQELVEICFIDNVKGGSNDPIMIYINVTRIGIKKNYVEIVKEYDNTNTLSISDIRISDVTETLIDNNGKEFKVSTAMLASNANKELIAQQSGVFSDVKASKNYIISRVTISFTFGKDVLSEGIVYDYEEDDVAISMSGNKIDVTITNIGAEISKKQLKASSFSTLTPVTRDYNATNKVDVEYEYAANGIVTGDSTASVGLRLVGTLDGKDAGTHKVSFVSDDIKVSNPNYEVDVADLNNKLTNLSVEITKARLIPNVSFADKVYDGETSVGATKRDGSDFTTLYYADNLKAELALIKIDSASQVKYVLSDKGAENGNVICDKDGNVLMHNVMVSGLKISVSDKSILSNYRIYGAVYEDKQYNYYPNVPDTIGDYEIIEAVKVSQKNVKLIINDFRITDKVYDGTNSATIDINVPVDSENRDGVLEIHKNSLAIKAVGVFASTKVGENIKVRINSISLVAKDNGIDITIINNYYLDTSAGAYADIKGRIIAKPVTVDVNLGERIYTGASDIVKSNITYSFDGVLAKEERNYNVATTGGAYFIDKNVAIDANGDVIEKLGNVYNPTLTNTKEYNINYVLAYKTTERESGRDADMLGFEDANGAHYYQQPASEEGVTAYYYRLRTVSKYVDTDDVKESDKKYIVGRYAVNGKEVYLVSDDYSGTTQSLAAPMTYLGGKGKITQRSVYITANSIAKYEEGEKWYNKVYDGTTLFEGTLYDGVTKRDTDAYTYTDDGIANVIKGDKVRIAKVSAEYNSANTNAMYVVFTASGITGEDASNYTIENKNSSASADSYSARLSARIRKREIEANLADDTMVYGTALGNLVGNITYKMGGYELVWSADQRAFFIKTKEFITLVGISDEKYVAQINANTYTNEFVKADENTVGEYFKLGGANGNTISNLPKPSARFNTTKPDAGSVAKRYYLTGGNASNFEFVYKYSNDTENTSRLEVTKKTLYVTTAGINHTKIYGGTNPAIALLFEGVASGDGPSNIFTDSKGIDYRPVVVLVIATVEKDGTVTYAPADKYAKPNDKLEKNQYYVYYLQMPSGLTSYDTFKSAKNYNVVIGDQDTLKAIAVKDNDGNVTSYKFVNEFESGYSANASTITISLPVLTDNDFTVDTTNNTFTYTYDTAQKKGVNRVPDMLKGAKPDDIVTYFNYVDGDVEEVVEGARDAGVHNGYIQVTRRVKVDDNDPNGYVVIWRSKDKVTINIERASTGLKADVKSVYYNGEAQEYKATDKGRSYISYNAGVSDESIGGLRNSDYTVSYKLYKNGKYEDVTSAIDAGTYVVTVQLTEAFFNRQSNYKQDSVETKLIIKKIIVNVDIDTTGYTAGTETAQDSSSVTKLTAAYEDGRNYTIDYTVAMGEGYDASNPSLAIDKSRDTVLSFAKDANGNEKAVNGAGKYSFTISITTDNAANYSLVGNVGLLELTTNTFNSDAGSVRVDGKGIVANRLEVKEIANHSISASDLSYVAIIKQFMPSLSEKANLKNEARVAAVVKMELYCDNQLVVLNGETANISVAIPDEVRKDLKGIALYTVTRDGGLKKLTDYTVNDGNIEYTTDYVSALVFVDVNPPALEGWKIGLIVGSILVVVIIATACAVGIVVRKKKLQKLI